MLRLVTVRFGLARSLRTEADSDTTSSMTRVEDAFTTGWRAASMTHLVACLRAAYVTGLGSPSVAGLEAASVTRFAAVSGGT